MFESHLRQLLDRRGVRNHHGPLRAKAPAGDGKGKTPTGGAGGGGGDDEGDDEDEDTRIARIVNTQLNAAITGHVKRLKGDLEKSFGDVVAKALSEKKPEEKPADQGNNAPANGAKVDPEVAKLREQLDKITRTQAETEARAKAAETKALRDTAHATLREQLDTLGVKGVKARAVIHDLEQSGALRLNDETGAYELVVKRARSKNAKAEELVFDDLSDGLKDWGQTEDAREFLPPPSPTRPGASPRPGQQPSQQPRRASTSAPTDRPLNDSEIAAQMERSGLDFNAALRG